MLFCPKETPFALGFNQIDTLIHRLSKSLSGRHKVLFCHYLDRHQKRPPQSRFTAQKTLFTSGGFPRVFCPDWMGVHLKSLFEFATSQNRLP
jgi:hypothetical protein